MTDEEITKHIFVSDTDLRGDVAFVFGTWKAYKESCLRAAELYKQKFVPKILVTGGINRSSREVEGDAMAEEIVKAGVPRQDVLLENKASNTLENVTFSLDVLDKSFGLKNIKTIVAVVKNHHARRALMTLKKHAPAHIRLKAATYTSAHYPFTKDNWTETEEGRKKVMEEFLRIEEYLAKGDIVEL